MDVKTMTAKGAGKCLERLMTDYDEFHWAVAWATQSPWSKTLVERHSGKLRRCVIGTDFGHTCPKLLRELQGIEAVRLQSCGPRRTFHPKVYGFVRGAQAAVLVGSSNFTNGGMAANEETSLLLEGRKDEAPIKDLLAQVENWWATGTTLTEQALRDYERRCALLAAARVALEEDTDRPKPKPGATCPDLLSMSWRTYAAALNKTPHVADRLTVLDAAHQLFRTHGSLVNMPPLLRKALCGATTVRQNEEDLPEECRVDWALFGNMRGAALFTQAVIEVPGVSHALDLIPLMGVVTRAEYDAYAEALRAALADRDRGATIVSASRLLTMKRPDVFMCVDTANRADLAKTLDFSPTTLNFENYWDRVVRPVMQSDWWRSPRPKGKSFSVWDGRVAMLDALFYDHGPADN